MYVITKYVIKILLTHNRLKDLIKVILRNKTKIDRIQGADTAALEEKVT